MSEPRAGSRSGLGLNGVVKTFVQGGKTLKVLRGITLTIAPGELVALVGPSGAGKSTLMHIAGLLERADSGIIAVAGTICTRLSEAERTQLRRESIGFVYQHHHLLPEFSALENVVVPQMIAGAEKADAGKRGRELLEMVGLIERSSHRPGHLSGGEQQRVAIARALANRPRLLLADEPTGNLDPHTAGTVFDVLVRLVRENRLAALLATHNLDLAARMDRTLKLEDGLVVES